MTYTEHTLVEFVAEAVDFFEWEDLQNTDWDVEIAEDSDSGFIYSDIVRVAEGIAFRFFVAKGSVDLNIDLPDCFELYRELETDHDEHASGVVLCWRGSDDAEDGNFWYMQRNEDGEIGVFHSDLSLDEGEEEEDAEEAGF
jgi:hypothetical protein